MFRNGEVAKELGIKDLNMTYPCDKKGHWAARSTGGGAKNKKHFCGNCALESADIAKPNRDLCRKWCIKFQRDPNAWRCHHHETIAD